MQFIKSLIKFLILFFSIFFLIEIFIYEVNIYEKRKIIEDNRYCKINSIIKANDNEAKYKVIKAIYKIPEKHIDFLIEKEWEIIIDKKQVEDICNTYFDNNIEYSGVTYNKIMYISEDADCIEATILHEVGHALDIELNKISKSEEFEKIFEKEKINAREYAQENIREFWADIYAICYEEYNNDKKNKFPLSIKYIKEKTLNLDVFFLFLFIF